MDTKKHFDDWEIDTIVGENNKGAIATIVERKTAFMMMGKRKGAHEDSCTITLCIQQ